MYIYYLLYRFMTSCYNSTCMHIYIYRDSICKIGKPIICHPQNHENNEFYEPSANASFIEIPGGLGHV